jgi:hypothetical protein
MDEIAMVGAIPQAAMRQNLAGHPQDPDQNLAGPPPGPLAQSPDPGQNLRDQDPNQYPDPELGPNQDPGLDPGPDPGLGQGHVLDPGGYATRGMMKTTT